MSIEIEVELSGAVKEYGMFSELGNAAVHGLVLAARNTKAPWAQVCGWLEQLSNEEIFAEATDTMVREYVYSALGYDNSEQSFYGA